MSDFVKVTLMVVVAMILLAVNGYAAVFISVRSGSDRRSAVRNAKGSRGVPKKEEQAKGLIPNIKMIDFAYGLIRKRTDGFLAERLKKAAITVQQAGYTDEKAAIWYLVAQYLLPAVVLLMMLVTGRDLFISAVVAGFAALMPSIVIGGRTVERKKEFQKTSYKIYKYLSSQVASGVTPFNAMKGVYQAVENKEVSYALASFVAKYELTQDLEQSAMELKKRFDSREAETLVVAFEQGIKTGDNSEILALQEVIMFDNYMNLLQEEHKKTGMLAFLAALLYAIGAAIVLSIPIIVEMLNGFDVFFEK